MGSIVSKHRQPKSTGRQAGASKPDQSATARTGLAIALENVNTEALDRLGATGASSAPGSGKGPKVIASGRGSVAEQILQIAFERGIKVRRDSDLAEILSAVEVESEIPLAALAGVAEILRYLYQTDKAHGLGSEAAFSSQETPIEEKRS